MNHQEIFFTYHTITVCHRSVDRQKLSDLLNLFRQFIKKNLGFICVDNVYLDF